MLELHPAVEVRHIGVASLELFDPRTELRFILCDVPTPAFAPDNSRVPTGEVGELCTKLGLTHIELDLAELHERQREFRVELLAEDRRLRLDKLLLFVRQSVPFFRSQPGTYKIPIHSTEDIARLPIMEKGTVRAGFNDLLADGVDIAGGIARGELESVATSGTTGERLHAISDMELARLPAEFERIWDLRPFTRSPRTAVIASPNCMGTDACTPATQPRWQRIRKEYTLFLPTTDNLFSMSVNEVRNIIQEMSDFAPDFLLVNPVYAHWIARKAFELGVDLPKVTLILSSYQFLLSVSVRPAAPPDMAVSC